LQLSVGAAVPAARTGETPVPIVLARLATDDSRLSASCMFGRSPTCSIALWFMQCMEFMFLVLKKKPE